MYKRQDLLYACLLDLGLGIHLPHTSRVVGGCTVHRVDGGVLAACFDAGVPDTVIRDIAASRPQWAVFLSLIHISVQSAASTPLLSEHLFTMS